MSDRGNKDRRAELERREKLCGYCPPHAGENAGRWVKHGPQKPKSRLRRGR